MRTNTLYLRFALIAAAFALIFTGRASAKPYTVPWFTVDGGGAMFSSGGNFTVGGTIGQPDAGPANTATGLVVQGGFWTVSVCVADFDGDGFISGVDFDLFVQAFENGDPIADIDMDGFVTGVDFDAFVQEFERGCP